jgi:GT2 family glycosyltransferase
MALSRLRDTKKEARREESIEPDPAPYPESPVEDAGPKVTAILIVYNQAESLRRAIEALERSHDRERLEILVVDCGSQDESPQLDVEYPSVTMMRLPHHFGATKAMNIGTRTAKAETIFYLSPAVEVAPDTVTKLSAALEQESDAAAVCPLLVDSEGRPVVKVQRIPTPASLAAVCRGDAPPVAEIDLTQESVAVEYPGIDALMVRKQFVKGMNYFDGRYGQYWADADLAMQVRRAQKKIRLYPGIRVTYHPEPSAQPEDPLLAADRALGAAEFVGKYNGFMAGLGFRISASLRALGRLDMRQFSALVSGQKLDGSQAG